MGSCLLAVKHSTQSNCYSVISTILFYNCLKDVMQATAW